MEKGITLFYYFFHGILVFEVLVFMFLYNAARKKDFLYFGLFLLLLGVNFILNSTDLYGMADRAAFMYSPWYNLVNTPLVIGANIFYVLFLATFYHDYNKDKLLFTILTTVKKVLLGALLIFLALYSFGIISNLLFNILHLLGIVVGVWLAVIIYRSNLPFKKLMLSGFISNLAGTLVTICMLLLQNTTISHPLIRDYPYIFIQFGLLGEIFFFNLAILAKWVKVEKDMAVLEIKSELAVEKVKSQISKELHDDIGSNLSGIQMYSHMARQEALKGNTDGTFNALDVIQSASGQVVNHLKDMVWAIHPGNDNLQSLADKIYEYAIFMAGAKNIQLVFENGDKKTEGHISTEWRHQVFMIAKEAINNTVKYSNATTLHLNIEQQEGFLLIEIKDNGSGFSTNSDYSGNGLKNMKKRAEEIAGELSIESMKEKGTTVKLLLKITH